MSLSHDGVVVEKEKEVFDTISTTKKALTHYLMMSSKKTKVERTQLIDLGSTLGVTSNESPNIRGQGKKSHGRGLAKTAL